MRIMKAVIKFGFSELIIEVDPTKKIIEQSIINVLPGIYAPWPEAKNKGTVELEISGNTLRALLTELCQNYQQVNSDFIPYDHNTNQVNLDYEVLVNGNEYSVFGLDTKLKENDKIKVSCCTQYFA
jgi:molybdopterin converting factor small subunit